MNSLTIFCTVHKKSLQKAVKSWGNNSLLCSPLLHTPFSSPSVSCHHLINERARWRPPPHGSVFYVSVWVWRGVSSISLSLYIMLTLRNTLRFPCTVRPQQVMDGFHLSTLSWQDLQKHLWLGHNLSPC